VRALYLIAVANLRVIPVLNESRCGVELFVTLRISLTDAAMCMNLMNDFC